MELEIAPRFGSPVRLRRLHDGPHNRHIPRYPNERRRIPTWHLRSIRTIHKTQDTKIEVLKEIIRAWGLNPEEILTREAISTPHRTVVSTEELENKQIKILCNILKSEMKKELRPTE